ncbi:MAG: sterol desaturase family protein [Polyangiaceae bacterium]
MLDRITTAALVFGVLLLAFGPLERAFPARRAQPILRREWLLDLYFFLGQYLLWNALALWFLTWTRELLSPASWVVGAQEIERLPWLVRTLAGLLFGDMLVYWFHRACHRFEFLWRFHAVHHSSETLDWLAAHREHPVDGILTQLCQNVPFFLLGVRMDTIGALVVFRGAWALLVHSNVRLPLGPLRTLLGAPELHHWHHARTSNTKHNFANLAPWLDILFGTHFLPSSEEESYELGNPTDDDLPRNYIGMMLTPLLSLVRRKRAKQASSDGEDASVHESTSASPQ